MEALKAAGGLVIGIGGLALSVLLGVVLIYGATWVSAWAIPYMAWATNIAVVMCFFIFLPLSFFRRTRFISAHGFLYSSFLFGICLWMYGLLITMALWGVGAVVIGIMLAFVGVVPIGMLAAIFNAEWSALIVLIVGTVFTYGSRIIALRLAAKIDEAEFERRNRIVEGQVV